jgi:hypothetical protein
MRRKGSAPDSSGPISFDGDAAPLALVRPIIPDGAMHHTAVVPKRDIVLLPPEPDLEVDVFAVIEKQV